MTRSDLPVGLVTFYFSDIEGSTRLVQSLDERVWAGIVDRHYAITEGLLAATSGVKVRTVGDEFFLVFPDAVEAAELAAAVHRAHAAEPWPEGSALRVRIGLHSGLAALGGDDYVGFDVHLAARIAATGHGGQTVISSETARRIRGSMPAEISLEDLGSHRLKDIAEPHRLFQMTVADLQHRFPALKTEGRGELRIPADPTAFIGREAETNELAALLADNRLITLTGPGGSGKTRLAKHVAEVVVDDFPDGIYFVDLSALEDPGLVPAAVLTALGVHQAQGFEPLELAIATLVRSRACLILDNLEQILDARVGISALLDGTQHLKIIATSRGPLRVAGEQEFPVPPLAVVAEGDGRSSEAVELFVARARDINPDFDVDDRTSAAMADVVVRLDGLPLAIELAAARTRLLSVPDLLERLGSSLDILKTRRPDLPPRQQTLRGAIQWSYDLLDEESQYVLADFSVFAGGCRLTELDLVCRPGYPDLLEDALEVLIEQSLVRREGSRYRMLQTIREFGLERLAERGSDHEIRDRHAVAYRGLAEELAPSLLTVDRPASLDLLAADHDNFRAALDRAEETGDIDTGLALGAALWRFWQMRGHLVEARERLEALTAVPSGDRALRARAFEGLGGVSYWQGDFDAARVAYQSALDLIREVGDEGEAANALYNLSFSYGFAGDYETGGRLLEEAREIYTSLGDEAGLGRIAWGLGNKCTVEGELESARRYFEESAERLQGGDDDFSYGWARDRLGVVLTALGEIDAARENLTAALDLFTLAEDISATTIIFNDFADNALRAGDLERALRISGVVGELQSRSGAGLVAATINEVEGMDEAVIAVGRERADVLIAEGRAMSFLEAISYVRGDG